jgi:O-succinylbenzoate synthase
MIFESYQFSFRLFSQKFIIPVVTSHGIWEIRHSIIIRLVDQRGRVGWGEISPLVWFGSEDLEQALDFCQYLPTEITTEIIFAIPHKLPACQFGFESALLMVEEQSKFTIPDSLTYCGLLSAGGKALTQWQNLWEFGYHTFKWKIGVEAIAQELEIFHTLIDDLPDSAKLRLDANGGLNYQQAELWLRNCDAIAAKIEFLEQPLPILNFGEMLKLSKSYSTAIALDESVARLEELNQCFQQGWRGIFVIKPGIFGSPSGLRYFCQEQEIDIVFSSVFETEIGRQAALQLAVELSRHQRAVGFGINHLIPASEENWLENLWNSL